MFLSRIRLRDFRSFRGDHELELPVGPGLYFLAGRNDLESRLGSNGSGKSTLWDALVWVLYGVTSRGLRAGAIPSWGTKGTEVEVDLHLNGSTTTVRRGWGPSLLEVDGRPATQEEVDARVGVDLPQFLASVVRGQMSGWFLDAQPAQRLTLVSAVLQLHVWEGAAKRAGEEARRAQGQAEEARREEAKLVGARDAGLREVARLEALAASWSAEREQVLRAWRQSLAARELWFSHVEKERMDADGRAFARASQDVTLEHERSRRAQEVATSAQALQVKAAGVSAEEHQLGRAQRALGDGKCSTCGQDLPEQTRLRLQGEVVGCTEDLMASRQRLEREAQAHRALVAAFEEHEAQGRTFLQETARLCEEARSWAMQEQKARRDLDEARQAVHHHEAVQDPNAAALASAKGEVQRAGDAAVAWAAEAARQEALSAAAQFWVRGFAEVRLWLVEGSLAALRAETAATLEQLGLSGWEVLFEVERETKAKTVSRGFHALVRSPHSPQDVPYEAWSGGETQRLRVAVAAAVAGLVGSRVPALGTLEVWDEPTAHLSPEGVEDLLRALRERAADRQVWLVDHRAVESGHFDGVLRVEKTEAGSKAEWE